MTDRIHDSRCAASQSRRCRCACGGSRHNEARNDDGAHEDPVTFPAVAYVGERGTDGIARVWAVAVTKDRHQGLKFRLIRDLPRNGWRLTVAEIAEIVDALRDTSADLYGASAGTP